VAKAIADGNGVHLQASNVKSNVNYQVSIDGVKILRAEVCIVEDLSEQPTEDAMMWERE